MAQAILLESVDTLGVRGDVVDVASGYLRNFLVPHKLAEPATAGSIAAAQRRHQEAERAAAQQVERAEQTAALLRKTVLTISHQAGDDGRLFGSVTAQDVVDAVRQARGIKIDRRRVHVSEPIRTTGTHAVDVEVSDGILASIKTIVTAE